MEIPERFLLEFLESGRSVSPVLHTHRCLQRNYYYELHSIALMVNYYLLLSYSIFFCYSLHPIYSYIEIFTCSHMYLSICCMLLQFALYITIHEGYYYFRKIILKLTFTPITISHSKYQYVTSYPCYNICCQFSWCVFM